MNDDPVWLRVPGYESDVDDSDADGEDSAAVQEETEFRATAQARLREVAAVLGDRWNPTHFLKFTPPPPGTREARPVSASGRPGARFRIEHTDAPVVRDTLLVNGMRPTQDKDWLIQWSGPSVKEATYAELDANQRVNHFPGSTELTRKDRLWCHFQEMAHRYGREEFDFVPETYVLPEQVDEFLKCYERVKGLWIVKPHASSRGRGIFLLQDLKRLPLDETSVVSRYVHNPMLIQGLKFDLRVYVLVTSYEPLRAYLYREGLTRFASKPYSTKRSHLDDAYRHLTNYSINKSASNFVENASLGHDNVGHKWSLSALNKHLRCAGVDTKLMWRRIMDILVKALLSVEHTIAARTRKATSHSESCFELYGFDVLVDERLKPWLLEVNLSPSMQAESPLDWQIKSSLLSDALNLVGVCRHSLAVARMRAQRDRRPSSQSGGSRYPLSQRRRRETAVHALRAACCEDGQGEPQPLDLDLLDVGQLRVLARACDESGRNRNFIRLYPTRAAVRRYAGISRAAAACAPSATPARHRDRASRGDGIRGDSGGYDDMPTASQLLAALLYGPPPLRASREVVDTNSEAGDGGNGGIADDTDEHGPAGVFGILSQVRSRRRSKSEGRLGSRPVPAFSALEPGSRGRLSRHDPSPASSSSRPSTAPAPLQATPSSTPVMAPALHATAASSPVATPSSWSRAQIEASGGASGAPGSSVRAEASVAIGDGCRLAAAEYLSRIGRSCLKGVSLPGEALQHLMRNQALLVKLAQLEQCILNNSADEAAQPAFAHEAEALLRRLASRCSARAATLTKEARAVREEAADEHDSLVLVVRPGAGGVGTDKLAASTAAATTDTGDADNVAFHGEPFASTCTADLERLLAGPESVVEFRSLLFDAHGPGATSRRPTSASAIAAGGCSPLGSQGIRNAVVGSVDAGPQDCVEKAVAPSADTVISGPLVELERCLSEAAAAAAAAAAARRTRSTATLRLEAFIRGGNVACPQAHQNVSRPHHHPRGPRTGGQQRAERTRCMSAGSLRAPPCRRPGQRGHAPAGLQASASATRLLDGCSSFGRADVVGGGRVAIERLLHAIPSGSDVPDGFVRDSELAKSRRPESTFCPAFWKADIEL
eukprot:TRINITY_DN26789_c0_g1_i1.p1 TRINITY_DN26789_c0_g1~~TRINITY_DN26789_c0_g1_i1.p1  ORF type:complete len:1116 (-),score=139.62 TRINITY_DN26789_c0_g1_i1:86-3433(-)